MRDDDHVETQTNVCNMNINRETFPNLFNDLVALRDLLTRTIDANNISDSSYDALSNALETTTSRVLNAYEFECDDDQYRIV